jgi:hypothetical protein
VSALQADAGATLRVRLRAYAYAHDRRLSEVAGDIVARRLKLSTELDLADDGDA